MSDERAVFVHDAAVGASLTRAGWTSPDADPAPAPPPLDADRLRLFRVPPDLLQLVPPDLAEHLQVLPLEVADGAVTIACGRPLTPTEVAALQLRFGRPIRPVPADPGALADARRANYAARVTVAPTASDQAIRLADELLERAVALGASDVHLAPTEHGCLVRFRLDGVLHDVAELTPAAAERLIAYLKTLAGLDYSQRGRALDGHVTRTLAGRPFDIRFESIGTVYGLDTVVLRLLDRRRARWRLGDLGLTPDDEAAVRRLLAQKQGLVLIAGPTGHGKSTTLIAAVGELDAVQQHLVTLEDPVEVLVPHVTQIPVGGTVTFAEGLRAVLRLDPDIIVVGELRDPETLAIAVQAALSGHLVLSSIHAIDAPATIFRLLERGIEPYLLAAALTGIVAQRLVRRICPHCVTEAPPDPVARAFLSRYAPDQPLPATLPQGTGCNRCHNTGYLGREAVAEILPVTETLRSALAQGVTPATLAAQLAADGFRSLSQQAAAKVLAGRTTVAEVTRVLAWEA